MKNLFLPLLLLCLFSCDFDREDEDPKDEGVSEVNNLNEYVIGSKPKKSRKLTINEQERGEKICLAFSDMRDSISPFRDVRFSISEKNCLNQIISRGTLNARINPVAESGPILTGNGLTFLDVHSDLHPDLKRVCAKVINNEESLDTFKVDARKKIQVRFRKRGNQSFVQIYEFKSDILEFIHTIEVGMNSSNEGFSISRSMSKRCQAPGRVHSYTQNLISL